MKSIDEVRSIERLRRSQRGVFSLQDLRTTFDEPHDAALHRRLNRLLDAGVLRRFGSGFYVTESFDLGVLSQRIAPESAVSFETVLAQELVIGPRPANSVSCVRSGRSATFSAQGASVVFHHLAPDLRFGETSKDGVRRTDAEKAMLDVLAFHLRGRRALFDLHGDVNLERLDRKRLVKYLARYSNPKFVAFARQVLRLP
ncbi:MAG: hypothetical protein HZA53_13095 [Planctomycetes bacterium]|nr:hypothetical protein [Planctomycetota bacterium]